MSKTTRRCAVYCRVSSDERLGQEFNSLDAQRAAGEAYVRSQQHEGWKLIKEKFDDGGFSGGTLERPALERLLDLVRSGDVDTIVVYKIDRLTRSLMDFAKLAELFDEHGVSFVSVTQSFNTTDSMGRLMLNVLLSFAQFEREVTGERIRDKIAASKKKGMWMGGSVPAGYLARDRQLVVDPPEANKVRRVFELFIEEGSVPALVDRLKAEGIMTPIRVSKTGRRSGGVPWRGGNLYHLLSNVTYIGRIPHRDTSYPGTHERIIDQDTWDKVQAQLAANAKGGRTRRRRAAEHPSLLAGILVDEDGQRLIASHAQKGKVRYRYYVREAEGDAPALRLPAREVEQAVLSTLSAFLSDPHRLLPALGALTPDEIPPALSTAAELADRLVQPQFGELVVSVVYRRDRLALYIDINALRRALGPAAQEPERQPFTLEAPLDRRRRGVQMKLIVGDAPDGRQPDPALVTAVARGHDWANRLMTGEARSVGEIAKAEGMTPSYVSHVVRLGFLSPELVEAILEGRQPADMTADALIHDVGLPVIWEEQV